MLRIQTKRSNQSYAYMHVDSLLWDFTKIFSLLNTYCIMQRFPSHIIVVFFPTSLYTNFMWLKVRKPKCFLHGSSNQQTLPNWHPFQGGLKFILYHYTHGHLQQVSRIWNLTSYTNTTERQWTRKNLVELFPVSITVFPWVGQLLQQY